MGSILWVMFKNGSILGVIFYKEGSILWVTLEKEVRVFESHFRNKEVPNFWTAEWRKWCSDSPDERRQKEWLSRQDQLAQAKVHHNIWKLVETRESTTKTCKSMRMWTTPLRTYTHILVKQASWKFGLDRVNAVHPMSRKMLDTWLRQCWHDTSEQLRRCRRYTLWCWEETSLKKNSILWVMFKKKKGSILWAFFFEKKCSILWVVLNKRVQSLKKKVQFFETYFSKRWQFFEIY